MDLRLRLDQVDAELSDQAQVAELGALLTARGGPPAALTFVLAFIRTAIAVARSAVLRAPVTEHTLTLLWKPGGGIASRIDDAYCTLAFFVKSTPAHKPADSAAKARFESALRLMRPYLTKPVQELENLIDNTAATRPGATRGLPGGGQRKLPAKPMADWRQVSPLLQLPEGDEPAPGFPPDTATQLLVEDVATSSEDLPQSPTETFRGAPPAAAPAPAQPRQDVPLYDVWFGTNRKPVDGTDLAKGFTNERDPKGEVHYGSCSVEVPCTHQFGSLGTPFLKRWLRLKFSDDHLKLRKIEAFASKAAFMQELHDELQGMPGDERSVLVYLHGYNTSFTDAALRAAQIGFDLKAPLTAFYSWPSMAAVEGYPADIARVEASEEQIADFLKTIAGEAGAAKVHVIAHSMGNRGFARAIARITSHAAATHQIRFGQIILAAPDLDVDLFKQLAVAYPKISERTTMYVSARDKALAMSSWLQDSFRAGYTPPVTVLDGIDTVEVTNIDLTMLGHGYFAAAEPVLYDIKDLIEDNKPPGKRLRVEAHADGDAKYWVIRA